MKIFIIVFVIILSIYILFCSIIYFYQEEFIFYPQKLDSNYKFQFDRQFEELNIKTSGNDFINGLLFKSNDTKGLIFYLHGNAGSLSSWGEVAKTYTDLNYDVFIYDYRGYGKSKGEITNENQLFQDNQIVYNELKQRYTEDKIIILGYSLGTGLAAHLASNNGPKLLILQAPYYSMTDMMKNTFPFLPAYLLKYKLSTHEYLKKCKMQVVIFHGDKDDVIYYGSSLKLQKEFKPQDTLFTLKGQSHNGITDNEEYLEEIKKILFQND